MPLTRPPLSFLNSNSTVFNDPLLVLHQGSGSADSDVGFVFNRANGLVANVAVYWSETDDTFYTAYTNSGGATDANLVPTSYAPFTVGTINANNAVVTGNLTVSGTTTTINTTNSTISDSLIELNSGAGSNANDLGFIFERGSTGDNAAIIWDESADVFVLGTTTATGASTGDLTVTAGALSIGSLTLGVTNYNQKQYVLYGTTSDATETEIFVGGSSRIPVASNTTIFYEVNVVARRTDATGESGGWHLKAVVDNFSGTVADVGTVYEVQVASDDANYAVDARADDTNDSIGIYVTGVAGKTISWTAIVKTFEVAQ
jgi:hypothetical protein